METARIPYGHTRTYSQIAAQLREAGVAACASPAVISWTTCAMICFRAFVSMSMTHLQMLSGLMAWRMVLIWFQRSSSIWYPVCGPA